MRKPVVIQLDPIEYWAEGHVSGVHLSNALFRCTKCGAIRPATDFGLRVTKDGLVRNQAQCKSCRFKSKGNVVVR